jgi:ATPase subunit of ABC transporter with duplicated ATPase domains
LCKVLAGESVAAAGTVERSATVGYLPQDPRTGDLDTIARDRVLSARGIDELIRGMEKAQIELGERPNDDALIRRYGRLEERFTGLGGYAAEAEAERICSNLGLPERVLDQPLGTLSGGQRRRVELARILFSDASTLLLDEPTNHLDADSIGWLRDYLRAYAGGLIVISHDVDLLDRVVNKVFHLDANRAALDLYNIGWKAYLQQREVDERRRHRERANAEKKAAALMAQADKMRAKATKAVAAQNMARRAERLLAGVESERVGDRVARIRFPDPAPCGRVPLTAEGLSKCYGSLEVFTDVDLAIDRGSRVVVLGLNGAGKTTLLRILGGIERPDTGEVLPGHGLRLGYYAQEHETLDPDASVLTNLAAVAPHLPEVEQRKVLGSFLFSGDVVNQAAGTLSGGEKTRLALARLVVSSANVLLLDEPTNNLDPASREQVLSALHGYAGAIVLVTHDEGAVDALSPQRVLLLPDGIEDHWSAELADLVALA